MFKDIYQRLYESPLHHYGSHAHGRCPGTRYLPQFESWLIGNILDVGSGTGDLVSTLRFRRYNAQGIDQVMLGNGMMVGDITDDACRRDVGYGEYDTILCLDVLEHLSIEQIPDVLDWMAHSLHQVISICDGPSLEDGFEQDLHTTQMPVSDWYKLIARKLNIHSMFKHGEHRALFLCWRRPCRGL